MCESLTGVQVEVSAPQEARRTAGVVAAASPGEERCPWAEQREKGSRWWTKRKEVVGQRWMESLFGCEQTGRLPDPDTGAIAGIYKIECCI